MRVCLRVYGADNGLRTSARTFGVTVLICADWLLLMLRGMQLQVAVVT